jgi:hypothetical protein
MSPARLHLLAGHCPSWRGTGGLVTRAVGGCSREGHNTMHLTQYSRPASLSTHSWSSSRRWAVMEGGGVGILPPNTVPLKRGKGWGEGRGGSVGCPEDVGRQGPIPWLLAAGLHYRREKYIYIFLRQLSFMEERWLNGSAPDCKSVVLGSYPAPHQHTANLVSPEVGSHLGWHSTVCWPLRGGRVTYTQKTLKIYRKKKLSFYGEGWGWGRNFVNNQRK